jgi:DNA repair exonuclease SbcCD ATPase subunit
MMATTTEDLATAIRATRSRLDRQAGELAGLEARLGQVSSEIEALTVQLAMTEQVAALLLTIGEARQETAQRQIEALVTMGLQQIFEPNLSFHIVTKDSTTKASVEFIVRSRVDDPTTPDGWRDVDTSVLDARGGGLAATVGFLLRLVVLLLSRSSAGSQATGLLVLDETFAHVSREYIERVAEFLKEITTKTGIQILMITHQDELVEHADKVYRFELDKSGFTKVTHV